jgi:hypothetical protein
MAKVDLDKTRDTLLSLGLASRHHSNSHPAQPGHSSGRLPPFQAIMVCDRNHFEERLEPAAKRR